MNLTRSEEAAVVAALPAYKRAARLLASRGRVTGQRGSPRIDFETADEVLSRYAIPRNRYVHVVSELVRRATEGT